MTKLNLVLLGEPKSTNTIYRSVCRGRFASVYMSHEGKKLKDSYSKQASEQFKGEPATGQFEVSITLYHGTHRKTDIDNFNKILFDSLTGIVWVDDSQIMSLTIVKSYDKDLPRTEVRINQLNELI